MIQRPIHVATLDKDRPVLVLTRSSVRPKLNSVTVAPITTTVRGIPVEVEVGPDNGLRHRCAVNLDNIRTIPTSQLGRQIGYLHPQQELALSHAIGAAFDLT